MLKSKATIKRKFIGEVVSDKMAKTIVVKVSRVITHPVYNKKIVRSRRFKVHDPRKEHTVGDRVVFEECRPLSKEKRWRVIGKAE